MSSTDEALSDLVRSMKVAAKEVIEEGDPVSIVYGTVEEIDPVKIKLDDDIVLSERQLILTEAVTDHSIEIEVDHATEDALLHTHAITGMKTILIKNGLEVGDIVTMIQVQGGQKFVVFDVARIRKRGA